MIFVATPSLSRLLLKESPRPLILSAPPCQYLLNYFIPIEIWRIPERSRQLTYLLGHIYYFYHLWWLSRHRFICGRFHLLYAAKILSLLLLYNNVVLLSLICLLIKHEWQQRIGTLRSSLNCISRSSIRFSSFSVKTFNFRDACSPLVAPPVRAEFLAIGCSCLSCCERPDFVWNTFPHSVQVSLPTGGGTVHFGKLPDVWTYKFYRISDTHSTLLHRHGTPQRAQSHP